MTSTVCSQRDAFHRRRRIRETLDRLQSCADLDRNRGGRKAWRSILELTDRELSRVKELKADMPERALVRVAEYFKMGAESVHTGEIDFREVAVRHCADPELPEPYRVAAFGRRRATISALDYLEKRSGWRTRRDVFRHFGVNEAMFSNPMDPISMRFITEVCSHLVRHRDYSHQDLYAMGANFLDSNRNSLIASVFSRCKGPAEVYSRLFGDMMKFFEHNCHYLIVELDDEHCVFDILSRPEVAEAMGVRHLGNAQLCFFKAGVISSMTGYLNLPFANIRKLSCVHLGDPTCRYSLHYGNLPELMPPF